VNQKPKEAKIAEFKFLGRKVRSRNFWDGGKTLQAKKWRWSLAANERVDMKQFFQMKSLNGSIPPSPIMITVIRVYPTNPEKHSMFKSQRKYDDDDMNGGCKHIRDGIAEGLGYKSDSHSDLKWDYKQIKTKEKQMMIVTIKTREVNND